MEMITKIIISIILFVRDREKELHNRRGILFEKNYSMRSDCGYFRFANIG